MNPTIKREKEYVELQKSYAVRMESMGKLLSLYPGLLMNEDEIIRYLTNADRDGYLLYIRQLR